MKITRYIGYFSLILTLFIFSIFFINLFEEKEVNFPKRNLPLGEIKTFDGNILDLDLLKKSEFSLLNVWATWCVPCKNELDAINEVYDDWQQETNVVLYAISVDDARTVKRVKPLVNGKDWNYEILLDTNNELKRALGSSTIPLTLIIKKGQIVYRHSGYVPGSEEDLYEEIKKHS